jgi:hypothetical protein
MPVGSDILERFLVRVAGDPAGQGFGSVSSTGLTGRPLTEWLTEEFRGARRVSLGLSATSFEKTAWQVSGIKMKRGASLARGSVSVVGCT